MIPDDLSRENVLSALDGAKLIYSDVRLHETALILAEEVVIFPLCCPLSSFHLQLWIFALIHVHSVG